MQIQSRVTDLLNQIGTSKISSAAYDTAWYARLIEIDNNLGQPALEWLRENQLPNGCWGSGSILYNHDRVICTLAGMIALTCCGTEQDKKRVRRARLGLDVALHSLQSDIAGATVGFEMIAPFLLDTAFEIGAIQRQSDTDLLQAYPHAQCYDRTGGDGKRRDEIIVEQLLKWQAQKITSLPNGMINRSLTMAFSAEMAGENRKDLIDIAKIKEANDSVGCSPSATAYFTNEIKLGDSSALAYLRDVAANHGLGNGGGIPEVAPFEVFEIAWGLWNLALTESITSDQLKLCEPHLDFLENVWVPGRGVGFSAAYTPKDGDDTSLVFDTMARYGRELDIEAVLSYERKDHFCCYQIESNPSVSVNTHVLGALRAAGYKADHHLVEKTISFLARNRILKAFWTDKWHASPYYATSHVIIASLGYANGLFQDAIDWIIETQRPNGAWGYYLNPTAEETAYCLQALFLWKKDGGQVPTKVLKNGLAWLEEHSDPPYETLWICKCLYAPELIIQSSILSALLLGESI
jgi:halimadienyl-diphosphate synthase